MKEAISLTLIFTFISWGSFLNIGVRDYNLKQHTADNLVYNYTQVAAKKGMLNEATYSELENLLDNRGRYVINLVAERFESNGTVTKINNEALVDYDLRENGFDIITISIMDTSDLMLNKVYGAYPMNIQTDYRIISTASGYIE